MVAQTSDPGAPGTIFATPILFHLFLGHPLWNNSSTFSIPRATKCGAITTPQLHRAFLPSTSLEGWTTDPVGKVFHTRNCHGRRIIENTCYGNAVLMYDVTQGPLLKQSANSKTMSRALLVPRVCRSHSTVWVKTHTPLFSASERRLPTE